MSPTRNPIFESGLQSIEEIERLEEERREEERRHPWRRKGDNDWMAEVARIVIPILLAWGIAVWTARSEAHDTVATEVAVIKAVQQSQFEEIQRTLHRLDDWIARQESRVK